MKSTKCFISIFHRAHAEKYAKRNRKEFQQCSTIRFFSDLSITCTVQCVICGEGINSHIEKNEEQNKLIFYLFSILPDPPSCV